MQESIDYLDDKPLGNRYSAEDMVFISKDVARYVLARYYRYIEDHEKAMSLIQDIMKSGYYNEENPVIFAVDGRALITWQDLQYRFMF